MTLKEQAVNGVLWSTAGTILSFTIEFLVGIFLARILTPEEFGLIGTIMVVIAISQVFVNSGFSQAIVRKQDCTEKDYSTAFYFNLIIGVFLFLILISTARPLSNFFNNNELKPLIQVLGTGLVISSLTLIQQSILIKKINFKLQTKIAIIAASLSGTIAILMAFTGFGVWSLVAKNLINQGITSSLLWYYNRWRPLLIFSLKSFKELFGFGSKLLLSGLIGTVFNNIYYAVIGKYFSAQDLGFYTRAELFKNVSSQNVERIVTSVTYPALAKIQDDQNRLHSAFRQSLTITFFVVAILMFGMAAVADSLIISLIGEQWRQSVLYLQMLCFIGLIYPLNSININLLNVVGRSDLYMKLQLVSQLFTIPVVVFGVIYGIKIMIAGMCINSLLSFLYFSLFVSKYSKYNLRSQLNDIKTTLLISAFMGSLVFFVGFITNFKPLITLIIQIILGALIVFISGELLKMREYIFIKETLITQYKTIIRKES